MAKNHYSYISIYSSSTIQYYYNIYNTQLYLLIIHFIPHSLMCHLTLLVYPFVSTNLKYINYNAFLNEFVRTKSFFSSVFFFSLLSQWIEWFFDLTLQIFSSLFSILYWINKFFNALPWEWIFSFGNQYTRSSYDSNEWQ